MTIGLVCCAVGDRQFAFRSSDVRHVVRAEHMRAGAGPDGRAGTLKIGGQQIPVFGLGGVLGEHSAPAADAEQHIAVTGRRGEMIGWIVDRLARAAVTETAALAPLPRIIGGRAAEWFEALIDMGGTSVLLLRPDALHPVTVSDARPCEAPTIAVAESGRAEPMVVVFSSRSLPDGGAHRFGLSARRVAAITQPLSLTTVPGSASRVMGVGWWRRAAVPVIDFRGRHAGLSARCLIARCDGRAGATLVAIPIDSDVTLHKPATADERITATPSAGFAHLFRAGRDTVALLDLDALLMTPH